MAYPTITGELYAVASAVIELDKHVRRACCKRRNSSFSSLSMTQELALELIGENR
jgi:hypothetical protein